MFTAHASALYLHKYWHFLEKKEEIEKNVAIKRALDIFGKDIAKIILREKELREAEKLSPRNVSNEIKNFLGV